MLEQALERILSYCTELDGGEDLARARETLHARCGEVAPGEPWYEERIRFFFDWYLCSYESQPAKRMIAAGLGSELQRRVAEACTRASRSLYRVASELSPGVVLQDLLGGGRFRAQPASPLRVGDVLDGFLIALDGAIHLLPGALFHPAHAHEALLEVVLRARQAELARDEVLDGLSRMRMRLDRFTSIRPRHVYRFDALGDLDILSAAWARRSAADSSSGD